MDITPYVESLRKDLSQAAEAAGPEGRAAAERMLLALEPAMRLALMESLSQAAAEITADLPAGVVEVRLRGREPQLVVDVPAAAAPQAPPGREPGPEAQAQPGAQPGAQSGTQPGDSDDELDDDGAIARVTLRIPEAVKQRAEELAGRSGHSLNGWIVSILRAATSPRAINVDIDLSSFPFLDTPTSGQPGRPGSRRMTGWV